MLDSRLLSRRVQRKLTLKYSETSAHSEAKPQYMSLKKIKRVDTDRWKTIRKL